MKAMNLSNKSVNHMQLNTSFIKPLYGYIGAFCLTLCVLTITNHANALPVEIKNASVSYTAIESIVLPDLNTDGIADIGVFYTDTIEDKLRLQVIDGASLNPSKLITWNNIYVAPTLHLFPDLNGNGVPEIGVFGMRTDNNNVGKPQIIVKDLMTGNNSTVYNWPANWNNVEALILEDMNGDNTVEVAIQGRFKQGDRPQLVVKNGATSNNIATYSYPNQLSDPKYFQHSDINGDGTREIATFGRLLKNNKIQVKISNGSNASKRFKFYNFPDLWDNISWVELDDKNNDGVHDWGLFGVNKLDGRPQLTVKSGTNPAGAISIFAWPADILNPVFFSIPDMNSDGIDEVAAAGIRTNGRYQFQVKDGADRNVLLANHNLKLTLSDVSYHVLGDQTADGMAEIGFLGIDRNGNYILQIQNGNGVDGTVAQYDLGSLWSSKPTLHNIDDINEDGLTEILFVGAAAGLTELQVWAIYDAESEKNALVEAFYRDNVSQNIIQTKCIICHTSNGIAAASRLHFENSSVSNYQTVNNATWQMFLNEEGVSGSYALSKVQGSLGHGGGQQLVFASEDYTALAGYLGLVTGEEYAVSAGDFWEGVGMTDNKQTLRRAAIIVAGRLPTDAEYASVVDNQDASLKIALRNLMQGEGFHSFLTEGANDRLLVEKFLTVGTDFLDFNFPYLAEAAKLQYQYNIEGRGEDFYPDILQPVYKGFTSASSELIAYVVENEKPYSEILTANYTMLNPALNRIYRGTALFDDGASQSEYKPGKITGFMLQDDNYSGEFIQDIGFRLDSEGTTITWPHAGILNDPAFLARYPSTATNRNRARSRWTQYLFLDFDIEKSTARTNDPAALADKDNPTMKNSNCTVCHQSMDPVAGAFQDYGDTGWYKDAWGGKDSLPDTYKWTDGSPYQEGDTWYRDMRLPGFYGAAAPDDEDSMQWLAKQVVADNRFATAAIKFWWPAVMGTKPVYAPEDTSDYDFQSKASVYSQQSLFIKNLADDFSTNMNLKDALVELLASPWFRANSMSETQREKHASNSAGVRSLLGPERLDRKTRAIVGQSWGEHYPDWKNYQRSTELFDNYRLTYGGIDSNGVINRAEAMTSVMSQVALTHAAEMSCGVVLRDFALDDADRKLFKGLTKNDTPQSIVANTFSLSNDGADNSQAYVLESSLTKGDHIIGVNYLNDWADFENLNVDKNLIIDKFIIRRGDNSVYSEFEASEIINLGGRIECGGFHYDDITGEDFNIWSNCRVELPLAIDVTGDYKVEVFAYGGLQDGSDGRHRSELNGQLGHFLMSVDLNVRDFGTQVGVGQQKIKNNIAALIKKFWGEFLAADDPEVKQLYGLFVDSWQAKLVRSNWRHIQEEGSACNFDYSLYNTDEEDGWLVGNDPVYAMSAWRTVIFYLMSDYRYLHE
jgi:hypothetical protein